MHEPLFCTPVTANETASTRSQVLRFLLTKEIHRNFEQGNALLLIRILSFTPLKVATGLAVDFIMPVLLKAIVPRPKVVILKITLTIDRTFHSW